ncbi:MAG TPA: hypothetical protein VFE37_07115 [Chloroflexota bacterium]|nr:hypothetical protein [Chloroflexota bacterium]
MQIVINHLTRMQPGFICVAGLDLDTGRHVRPMAGSSRLHYRLLAAHGGPFDVGAIVDLGQTYHVGRPPEVEDHSFQPRLARRVGQMPSDEFWSRLLAASTTRLADIFGGELRQRGARSCAVDAGRGIASLGCLLPSGPRALYIQSRPGRPAQVRARVSDSRFALDLGVTDIRLYRADHVTPDQERVEQVSARLQGGVPTVLAVGLTRASAGSPDYPPVHWLQVNGIHLEDEPGWRLG